ncbi:hypothetical protein PFICI_00805 [Pestalotiopsis fici W106-1]|uniref:Zn(2)-C6 fungal-type domain-containing protein n=1 Tax=Pestalotiopsis fici (strain W106-1 / CGMCC3.15140) TaxID=1229662 RepID=W3XN82_PESFW|nr:uncharacterized protein PFICI_00805 [Pestalotiopsis fici W106-1]ETS86977.1 hypothetical protein PFICI_00805 [Pestalotiopsis fici W106-1]
MSSPRPRRATLKACARCHRRKQRCVGYPACANCRTANIPCSRDSTPLMRRLSALSKEELIKKIEDIHSQVPELNADEGDNRQRHFSIEPIDGRPSPSASSDSNANPQRWRVQHPQPCGGLYDPAQTPEALSSGISTIATHFAVNSALQPSWPNEVPSRGSCLDDGIGKSAVNERQLLTTFLENLHRRLPFCDYLGILETLQHGVESPFTENTKPMHSFRLHMACAIGARVQQLTGSSHPLQPETYISRALETEGYLDNKNAIEMTERLLWHIMYKLRSSFTSDIWYSTGLAMRTAIDAGMHRNQHYQTLPSEEADLRRRLFWSVYVIERSVAWHLKRPVSLSDLDIDVELPAPGAFSTFLDSESGTHLEYGASRPLDLRVFIAIVRLSRINSQAYGRLHGTNLSYAAQEYAISLLGKIRQLEASISDCDELDREFLRLHIETAAMKMTEPFLSTQILCDDMKTACLQAAGGVCKSFKRQRLERRLGYSFTMVNTVFTAGVTICYIIFKNPGLWTPARANEMRVCSSALFAAAARNSAVDKYCEVLETIIEAVTEHVAQVESAAVSSALDIEVQSCSSQPLVQAIFDQLAGTIEGKGFEFPSQSYPSYCNGTTSTPQATSVPDWSIIGDNMLDVGSLDVTIWDGMSPQDPLSEFNL